MYMGLIKSTGYHEIIYDSRSGGLSAIHNEHSFDKSISPFGYPRGNYERVVLEILRKRGECIILVSETPRGKSIKINDAEINGNAAEIKTVESSGRWAIRTKLYHAARQNADIVILYFPSSSLYSKQRIIWGWERFLSDKQCIDLHSIISQVVSIVEGKVMEILKPPG